MKNWDNLITLNEKLGPLNNLKSQKSLSVSNNSVNKPNHLEDDDSWSLKYQRLCLPLTFF